MWSHCTWGLTQCDAPSPNPPLPIVRCSMLIFLTKSQLYSVCSHPSVFFFSEVCVEVHAVYVYIHCTIYSSIEASHYQQAPSLCGTHTVTPGPRSEVYLCRSGGAARGTAGPQHLLQRHLIRRHTPCLCHAGQYPIPGSVLPLLYDMHLGASWWIGAKPSHVTILPRAPMHWEISRARPNYGLQKPSCTDANTTVCVWVGSHALSSL